MKQSVRFEITHKKSKIKKNENEIKKWTVRCSDI